MNNRRWLCKEGASYISWDLDKTDDNLWSLELDLHDGQDSVCFCNFGSLEELLRDLRVLRLEINSIWDNITAEQERENSS